MFGVCFFFDAIFLISWVLFFVFFFFNDTATTEIYTLSLHDALPIFATGDERQPGFAHRPHQIRLAFILENHGSQRSEEHTSELQSQSNLVCRLLLEKKKQSYVIILLVVSGTDVIIATIVSILAASIK